MTTQEFQSQIIDSCKNKNACNDQFKLLLSVKNSPALFLQVLRNNHSWCVEKEIYTPDLLLQLDAELLLYGGFATQKTKFVDFNNSIKISNYTWAPFNHGGSLDNINGSYQNFDKALTLDYGTEWRQPTMLENCALASAPNMFGIYAGSFGRMFEGREGRVFLPASGYRDYNNGSFYNVGSHGYCWSESVSNTTNGYRLNFSSVTICPQNDNSRHYGFPVRCICN